MLYRIYLVGFPGTVGDSEIENTRFYVSQIIHHLVPEAQVRSHYVFGERYSENSQLSSSDKRESRAEELRHPECTEKHGLERDPATSETLKPLDDTDRYERRHRHYDEDEDRDKARRSRRRSRSRSPRSYRD